MTMTEYLKQGQLLDQRINYHIRKLREMRTSMYTLSSSMSSQERVQTSRMEDAPFIRALEKVEEMQGRINREIDLLVDLKNQIEGVIKQLEREEYQMMMIYRYLEGKSFSEIADLLSVSRGSIKRWHKMALAELKMPENPICIHNML